jgi:hypothetical protein
MGYSCYSLYFDTNLTLPFLDNGSRIVNKRSEDQPVGSSRNRSRSKPRVY